MVNKVVVLGGGSAGFLAALALKVKVPGLDVVVVRSKDLGIIGVGEGSTFVLTSFLHHYLRLAERPFFLQANPTWKLGLKFIWGPRPYFNYTFGPGLQHPADAQLQRGGGYFCDHDAEYTDLYSSLMTEDRVFPVVGPDTVRFNLAAAYHVENEKFVGFLESAALAAGVQIVEDTVRNVRRHEDGAIAGLDMASGRTETADLYVDASGFYSLLLGRTFGEPFISFSPTLFCDRAVVGGWTRGDDEVIHPYTTCETMDSGWCWQIEHPNRINRGYVYASAFVSDEEAERAFRERNPKVGPTRVVKFISGRYQRAWVKNVVAIGNAAGFVEPLEATSLGVIALQSQALADALRDSDRQPNSSHATLFNRMNADNWDNIRRFLAIHYRFNTRLDTPFWRHCREHADLAGAEPIVEFYRENGPTMLWEPQVLGHTGDQFGIGGYYTLLVGQKVPFRRTREPSAQELAVMEDRRRRNREVARRALSVKQALDLIHSPQWDWDRNRITAPQDYVFNLK